MSESLPISIQFPIHWGELDVLGHVNHARFAVWLESARMRLFETVGLVWDGKPTHGPILARLEVDYVAPVHFPAIIDVRVGVSKIGRTSFVLEYELYSTEGGSSFLAAKSKSVIVIYNYQDACSEPIPDDIRQALENLS
ncbi:MAG: thioesterase family protein [Myxococcota bacterium]|nr:thioesterase family protein [Myxococcota bacterium]